MLPVDTRGNPRRARARPARLPDLAGRTVHGRGPFPAGNADCHGPARGGSARKGGVCMARPSVTIGARGGGRIGGNGGGGRTGRPSVRGRRAWSGRDRRGRGAVGAPGGAAAGRPSTPR